ERTRQSTLGQLLAEIKSSDWNLSTMLLVGEALSTRLPAESRLYAKDYTHIFRVVKKPKNI
ncbi:MAG: precorrin-4 C(11)-methyltransferase, partial [Methylococcales bacterium]|nr:precorrin-4 C(11)-methyltransferase [Methylococcales bacterium]